MAIRKRKQRPTIKRLMELLAYNRHSGLLTWKIGRTGTAKTGSIAGSRHRSGYIYLTVDGKHCAAHVIAWAVVIGRWPKKQIDHRDGNGWNNRWLNLRPATNRQNSQNKRLRDDNRCGLKGVTFHHRGKHRNKRYEARIRINGKPKSLGYFETAQAAHRAYCKAAMIAFGEFARAA